MAGFIALFLSLYTAMHAIFYLRVRVLLPERRILQAVFIGVLLILIVAPVVSRLLERSGHESAARYLAAIAFNWTGFIFLAFCLSMVMLAADGLLRALNYGGRFGLPLLTGKLPAAVMIGLVFVLCFYGYREARAVKTERIRIETAKLPVEIERLKIVQISDVHIGLLTQRTVLGRIADAVAAENPDLLVSTGDLVDGPAARLSDLAPVFAGIETRYGKFAVTGNHEAYAGLARATEFTRKLGFTLLRGEARQIDSVLNVVGVDDPAVDRAFNEADLLAAVQNGLFTLFLKHRPVVSENSRNRFDLQLSGHTHGGQIYPFIHFISLQYPLPVGLLKFSQGPTLYTSRGSGTWGPQMRILSPPEITVIELVRKDRPPGSRASASRPPDTAVDNIKPPYVQMNPGADGSDGQRT